MKNGVTVVTLYHSFVPIWRIMSDLITECYIRGPKIILHKDWRTWHGRRHNIDHDACLYIGYDLNTGDIIVCENGTWIISKIVLLPDCKKPVAIMKRVWRTEMYIDPVLRTYYSQREIMELMETKGPEWMREHAHSLKRGDKPIEVASIEPDPFFSWRI